MGLIIYSVALCDDDPRVQVWAKHPRKPDKQLAFMKILLSHELGLFGTIEVQGKEDKYIYLANKTCT